MPSEQAKRTFRYKSTVKILPPSLSPERVKVDDFYAARSGLIPPLPWSTFSPPFSPELIPALPSHYKCPQTGAVLPVENPFVWVYQEEDEA